MGAASEHFKESELACHHCHVNECTQGLVDALEELRSLAGFPITINDAYRCPAHNAGTPNAAKNSQHQDGTAADIKIKGLTGPEMYSLAVQVTAFRDGGIGVAKTYIHVDVRATKARWCYDAAGKSCAWDKSLDSPAVVS